ncbi:MAG: gamma-glutamyl-gamma-aminobutyrate hydrolase family protein [Microgenomates group bacterium]
MKSAQYALKHKIPYLGLCLGLQMAVVAAARNAGVKDATTTELDPNSDFQVVSTMDSQKGLENTGGTMRLGNYPCELEKGSISAKYYKSKTIIGRHRHRYECNNDYRDSYEQWGIKAVGLSPDKNLVEVIEGIDHPFFVASQFHPEFNSRPNKPQPLFKGFVESLLAKKS